MQHIPCGTAINLAAELILFTMHALMLPTCTNVTYMHYFIG